MSTTYPFAPLKPSAIPGMLQRASVDYGIQLYVEAGNRGARSEKLERLAAASFALEARLKADIDQLEGAAA